MYSSKKKTGFSKFIASIPQWVWLIISLLTAVLLWILISSSEKGGMVFANPTKVFESFSTRLADGSLVNHFLHSVFRVIAGFACGFVVSIPVAFLMGWYAPFRHVVEPWIQFVRNIPPLAYIPLVMVGAGVGESAKVIVIFIASFLVLVVTIYQGVCNVDITLIKAARILGASDRDIFFRVIIPASTPFILTGARLGLSAALTTLLAAELTGASSGLGMMIQKAGGYYDMGTVLMGIIVIGVIGISMEKLVRFLERRLTGWQETVQR